MARKGRTPDTEESTQTPAASTRSRASSRSAAARNHAQPENQDSDASSDDRQKRIELAAYYRAERRGFTPGHELEDWLEAESEVE